MKRLFVALILIGVWGICLAEVDIPVYQTGYRTTLMGNTPILSIWEDRENSLYLPSVLPTLEKGSVYLDYNGTWGGIVIPAFGRKLYFHLFAQYDDLYIINSPRAVLYMLEGPASGSDYSDKTEADFIAPLNTIFGFGIAGKFGNLSAGANVKIYGSIYKKEHKVNDVDTNNKNQSFRFELTPSVSYKVPSLRVDGGVNFLYQWIDNSTNIDNYSYPYSYTGNAEFSIYGRTIAKITDYSDIVAALGFGYMGASQSVGEVGAKPKHSDNLDVIYLNVKGGFILKPLTWLTSGTSVIMQYRYFGWDTKLDNSTSELSGNSVDLTFAQTVDFKICDWFSLKAGLGKTVNIISGDSKTITHVGDTTTTTTDSEYNDAFPFGKFVGMAFDYKGFNLTAVINFDLLTKGPNVISGNSLGADSMMLLATMSYSW